MFAFDGLILFDLGQRTRTAHSLFSEREYTLYESDCDSGAAGVGSRNLENVGRLSMYGTDSQV